ncbi:hypothetical protein [Elusimicrobium minutum]|uniref:hypothetical protein n=1 Tax=Elusimicrobium minutum TaxID=423605 RepID=UPI0011D15D2A|nr:hypothetical protein [Elusimicrobium minutum]
MESINAKGRGFAESKSLATLQGVSIGLCRRQRLCVSKSLATLQGVSIGKLALRKQKPRKCAGL